MSVASTAPPRRRNRWWLLLFVPPVLLAALALSAWLLQEPAVPGKRMEFVMPGPSSAAFKAGGLKLELAPELQADNVQAELGAMVGSVEQHFVVRREVSQHEISVTAGNKPLQSSGIRYTLLDRAGAEIAAGVLWPDLTLQPNVKTGLIIGDFELGRAGLCLKTPCSGGLGVDKERVNSCNTR